MISSPTTMLPIVWNPHGFHVVKVIPRGFKGTREGYIDYLGPEICYFHFARDGRKLVVHVDEARPHIAARVKRYLENHSLKTAPDPLSSPDGVLSDFFLLGYGKRALQRSEFQSAQDVLDAVVRKLNPIPTDTLIGKFHEWNDRSECANSH
jgi:hypothetical protein